jgi:undecaprenyl-diphosphatase
MLAVVIYFYRDLWRIARAWIRGLRDPGARSELDARMGWYLIVGTIPISIAGVAFQDQIRTGARNLFLIGSMLIALGLILLLAERLGTRTRDMDQVRLRDGVLVGVAQALALIPGVSRSGSTITAGLFLGFRREDAARFSFLLSVPAVVLSGVFELRTFLDGADSTGVAALIVATAFAFLSGYAAIAFLLRFLVSHTTKVFVAYRVVLGTVVIALAATGAIA